MTHRQTEKIFATPLHIVTFDNTDFCDDVIQLVYSMKNEAEITGDLCWTTKDNLHTFKSMEKTNNLLLNECRLLFNQLGIVYNDVETLSMWVNVSKAKNRHSTHVHPNSFYSGVLYLNAPQSPGNIGFRDPRPGAEMWAPDFNTNSEMSIRTWEVPPVKGRLILFPSWLAHGTATGNFDDDKDRISLSFNVMIKGPITGHTRSFEYK